MRAFLKSQRPYVKDTLAVNLNFLKKKYSIDLKKICLLYTYDAADDP